MSKKQARLGSARRRGASWEARWRRPDGRESSKRGFPTQRAALDFAAEQMTASRKARTGRGKYTDPNATAPTFGVLADKWLATRRDKTANTLVGYVSVIEHWLRPEFGTVPVDKITYTRLEAFKTKMQDAGKAPGTIRNVFRVLNPIMRAAVRDGLIPNNPAEHVERGGKRDWKPEIITTDQVELLASVIEPHYAPMVVFAAYTGMRAGEVAALEWRHLDIEGGRVRVEQSVSEVSMGAATRLKLAHIEPGFVTGPPKNKHARTTVLLASVAEMLGEPGADTDLVFTMKPIAPATTGTRLRFDNWRKRVWAPAIAKAHKLDPDFPTALRLHDLRHAFVSIAYNELGLNPRQIAEMSGHRDLATMLNTYTHVFDGWDEKLAERFDDVRQRARLRLVSAADTPTSSRRKTA